MRRSEWARLRSRSAFSGLLVLAGWIDASVASAALPARPGVTASYIPPNVTLPCYPGVPEPAACPFIWGEPDKTIAPFVGPWQFAGPPRPGCYFSWARDGVPNGMNDTGWTGLLEFQACNACPTGSTFQSTSCVCNAGYKEVAGSMCVGVRVTNLAKSAGEQCTMTPNPVNPATGNKYLRALDYISGGPFPLRLERSYNSMPPLEGSFGKGWRSFYDRRVTWVAAGTGYANVERHTGQSYVFALVAGALVGDGDVALGVERLLDANGAVTGYRLTDEDEGVELYDAQGRLTSITTGGALTQVLSYDAVTGLLKEITDPGGRKLTFAFDAQKRISKVIDPAGGEYVYAYDAAANLVSMKAPDGATLGYRYTKPGFPNHVTRIVDELGVDWKSFDYDANGRAILSTLAGDAEKVTLAYPSATTTTITDALGTPRTLTFSVVNGVPRLTKTTQPCAGGCGGGNAATLSYDADGRVTSTVDFKGNMTSMLYDGRGLLSRRVEGGAGSLERTVDITWHPTKRRPVQVTTGGETMGFVYDAGGNLVERKVTSGGQTASWKMTYAGGQVSAENGPRTDVEDVTSLTYDAAGNLTSIVNALGHATKVGDYDAHGLARRFEDPNGLVTTVTYDARGRLATRTVGGETTTFQSTPFGGVKKLTLPDGSFYEFAYDAAHRLTQIKNASNERMVYTLDALGNVTRTEIFDTAGASRLVRRRVFDALGRLQKVLRSDDTESLSIGYDANGRPIRQSDGRGRTVTATLDALNRISEIADESGVVARFTNDALDRLTSIKDARDVTTSYAYDGLGNLGTTSSPDAGGASMKYDLAGNTIERTDAKGQTTKLAYDALNRLTRTEYADGTKTELTYDVGANAIGRLSTIKDASGSVGFEYDVRGRVSKESRGIVTTVASVSLTTEYAYDALGRIASVKYPSGRVVAYARGASGQLSGVTHALGGAPQPLVTQVTSVPFGAIESLSMTGGVEMAWPRDKDGRVTSFKLGTTKVDLSYDAASRVVGMNDGSATSTFAYDGRDRLVSASLPGGVSYTYEYDASGNRTKSTASGVATTYEVSAASNRLASVGGKPIVHDANGAITDDGSRTMTFDARGRLSGVRVGTLDIRYLVDARGQRVAKLVTK